MRSRFSPSSASSAATTPGRRSCSARMAKPAASSGRPPSVDLRAGTKVGVEEMAVRAEHAADLAQEGVEAAVAVRRLDVEHDVEGSVGERQPLGVADLERQARVREAAAAERDGAGRKIDGHDPARVELARQVVGAAATAAPHLQELAPRDGRTPRDQIVKLDARAIVLVGGSSASGGCAPGASGAR